MSLESRLPNEPEVSDLIVQREDGTLIETLDDGFVRYIDHMGSDDAIVQAARVSYGAGTKTVRSDRGLIRYLMSNRHNTPVESCVVKFHLRMPILVMRQHVRHRTFSINEYSARYSVMINSMMKTEPDEWRLQDTTNKQGSDGTVTEWPNDKYEHCRGNPGNYLSERERELQKITREIYEERLTFGVSREQSRKDMPVSNMTELYWYGNLHNIFHYLGLRMDNHAQLEIRTYANAIFELIKPLFPLAVEAFQDYRLDGMFLSGPEIKAIRAFMKSHMSSDLEDDCKIAGLSKRETNAVPNKLERLGIIKC